MRVNLKLSQQGLVLVGVPIGLMLIILLSLLLFLIKVEQEAAEIDRSKNIVAKANSMVKQYYDAASQLIIYKYTRTDEAKLKFDTQLASTVQSFDELQEMLKSDPEELKMLAGLKETAASGMALMRRYERYLAHSENLSMLEVAALYRKFDLAGAEFTAKLQVLINHETAKHRANSVEEERGRTIVKSLIVVGAVLAIAIAFALTKLFAGITTSRLATLMDNTVRLRKKEPLLPIVAGKDEIAELDQFFHQMADALAEAARKEQEVEKLKQEFVAVISHELRTPLTSLQATLTLLASGTYGDLNETGEKRVHAAENSITRLISLITDLLDIEKMEAGKLSMACAKTDISVIVERSIEAVHGFGEQQGVSIKADNKSVALVADADRIVQVLVNLLSNSIKFSPEAGQVEVEIIEGSDRVEVQVIDHGSGVPAGYEETIFQKYEQARAPVGKGRRGTGLGLPICKAIVEMHGGAIGVKGTAGGGSTFWFWLPTAGPPPSDK
jgi:signal transduction histidine kinase